MKSTGVNKNLGKIFFKTIYEINTTDFRFVARIKKMS